MSKVSFEGDVVDLTTIQKGPGYNHPEAVAARRRLLAKLEEQDVRIVDCIYDEDDVERVRRGVLGDLLFLDSLEEKYEEVARALG